MSDVKWKSVEEAARQLLQARDEDQDGENVQVFERRLRDNWLRWSGEPVSPPSDEERKRTVLERAAEGDREALSELWLPMSPVSLFDAAAEPLPDPIIRRRRSRRGAVLVEGEVALLVGEGKIGKSSLVIGLALAGASATAAGTSWGTACGLDVRCGPVVLAGWEDRAAVMGERALRWVTAAEGRSEVLGLKPETLCRNQEYEPMSTDILKKARRAIHVIDMRPFGHLFAPPASEWGQALTNALPKETSTFRRLWGVVDQLAPKGGALLVVDPVGRAFAGDPNSMVQVQSFLTALAVAAAERKASVLLVHHSNKAARRDKGSDADEASGAAAWTDGTRGVLSLKKAKEDLELKCLAANYGPSYWAETLRRDRSVLRRVELGEPDGKGLQADPASVAEGLKDL